MRKFCYWNSWGCLWVTSATFPIIQTDKYSQAEVDTAWRSSSPAKNWKWNKARHLRNCRESNREAEMSGDGIRQRQKQGGVALCRKLLFILRAMQSLEHLSATRGSGGHTCVGKTILWTQKERRTELEAGSCPRKQPWHLQWGCGRSWCVWHALLWPCTCPAGSPIKRNPHMTLVAFPYQIKLLWSRMQLVHIRICSINESQPFDSEYNWRSKLSPNSLLKKSVLVSRCYVLEEVKINHCKFYCYAVCGSLDLLARKLKVLYSLNMKSPPTSLCVESWVLVSRTTFWGGETWRWNWAGGKRSLSMWL